MRIIEKELFLKRSFGSLVVIYEQLKQVSDLRLSGLDPSRTALIVIDMVNGFTKEGPLSSHRVGALIPGVVSLMEEAKANGMRMLAFADAHRPDSLEFAHFPPHCVKGTNESKVVHEIKEVGGYTLVEKETTNGYLEPEFQKWLEENGDIENIIVVGDCTDICVQQFAVTLKKHYERIGRPSRVIVPTAHVETYELEEHSADLMNVVALYQMKEAGIEIVSNITLGGASE